MYIKRKKNLKVLTGNDISVSRLIATRIRSNAVYSPITMTFLTVHAALEIPKYEYIMVPKSISLCFFMGDMKN